MVRTHRLVNLIAATADDARDIMVEGESGILSICRDDERPRYLKGERKLLWPNGAVSLIFTADEPNRLRGKQHQALWADELASWRYPESWAQAMLGLRLPPRPLVCVSTTPRPIPTILELMDDPSCVVTRGTTYENRANLAPSFYRDIIRRYEGTRLGLQELEARLLTDNANALWSRDALDAHRVKAHPELKRVVVAVDPQAGEDGSETGIVVAGLAENEHVYVLRDASVRALPNIWAAAVAVAYNTFRADRVVAEENQGGKMVEAVLRTAHRNLSYQGLHASRGKFTRAEPVSALYAQGRVHHVGFFPALEDQMCQWVPGEKSPDRMDALVWAVTALALNARRTGALAW